MADGVVTVHLDVVIELEDRELQEESCEWSSTREPGTNADPENAAGGVGVPAGGTGLRVRVKLLVVPRPGKPYILNPEPETVNFKP